MNKYEQAIAYFEDAVRESDEIIADCSPALQVELTEQKSHFVVALEVMWANRWIPVADKIDKYEEGNTEEQFSKGKIVDYDKMPSRGKETSDGEKTKNHGISCGGRCYVHYDENRVYRVECENCGNLVSFKASSLDLAIKLWNDMPDAKGGGKH